MSLRISPTIISCHWSCICNFVLLIDSIGTRDTFCIPRDRGCFLVNIIFFLELEFLSCDRSLHFAVPYTGSAKKMYTHFNER